MKRKFPGVMNRHVVTELAIDKSKNKKTATHNICPNVGTQARGKLLAQSCSQRMKSNWISNLFWGKIILESASQNFAEILGDFFEFERLVWQNSVCLHWRLSCVL